MFYFGKVELITKNMEQNKHIELRSEKVRNIIGQVPPVLLRYGISIIALTLVVLVGIATFIPYQPSIDTQITATQDKAGVVHYSASISQKAMNKRAKFMDIITNGSTDLPLPSQFKIEKISDTAQLSGNEVSYTAVLCPESFSPQKVKIENSITVPAKIIFEKKSVLMWVVGK
ncbi:MAG: hypothetical protein H6Q18_893 [Bacteroidetes bacterium]|nr:hypothetical protein [Bacteroidota bacterium]